MDRIDKILEMLEENVISKEEAKKLINAIKNDDEYQENQKRHFEKDDSKFSFDKIEEGVEEIFTSISDGLSGAFRSFQNNKLDKITIRGIKEEKDVANYGNLSVEGVYNSNYQVNAICVSCKGVINAKDNISANDISIRGSIKAHSIDVDSLQVYGVGSADLINAKHIIVRGTLNADEINTDSFDCYHTKIIGKVTFGKAVSIKKLSTNNVRLKNASVEELYANGLVELGENTIIDTLFIPKGKRVIEKKGVTIKRIIEIEDII